MGKDVKAISMAASIALALAGQAAVAGVTPTVAQLPGKGTIVAGTVQAGAIANGV